MHAHTHTRLHMPTYTNNYIVIVLAHIYRYTALCYISKCATIHKQLHRDCVSMHTFTNVLHKYAHNKLGAQLWVHTHTYACTPPACHIHKKRVVIVQVHIQTHYSVFVALPCLAAFIPKYCCVPPCDWLILLPTHNTIIT